MQNKTERKRKLYRHASDEFGLPAFVDTNGHVMLMPAGDLPLMYWPDGRWCFEASMFIGELARQGLSRRFRGGTLLTYASHLALLLRYCHGSSLDFISFSDSHFRLFMRGVVGERRISSWSQPARSESSAIQVGRTCLRFLSFLSAIIGSDLVGPNGQIRAEQRTAMISSRRNGRERRVTYWHHPCFPTPSPTRRRLPVSSETIAALRRVVGRSSNSVFQKKRRYIMLKLLEITGGRRSEIAGLKVDSVLNAFDAVMPMLEIMTVKRRGDQLSTRLIPISRHDLVLLKEFIEKNRSIVIRKTCGRRQDQGFLLISETTGAPLRPNTITQEVAFLAHEAGIEERVSPHMFRHRFITKLFVALIEQHQFDNPDEFRRALISAEDFKRKVLEWTGHRNISSLDPYLHIAFHEIGGLQSAAELVLARSALDSFETNLAVVESDLEQGEAPEHTVKRLRELVVALREDISQQAPKG